MDISKLTEEDIRKSVESFFKEKLEDENVKPDLSVTETNSIFQATIRGTGTLLMTGKGGLRMFLKNYPVPILKIEYNGKTLSLEEATEFINRIKGSGEQ